MSMKPDKSFWLKVKEARLMNIVGVTTSWAAKERKALIEDIKKLKEELNNESRQT